MVASMLRYAEKNDKDALHDLDFRIVFMGASIDAMAEEPFCHYPDKLIHYKQLEIEETIDRHWKRNQKLCPESLKKLSSNLYIHKKAWFGVSCSFFRQIMQMYQKRCAIETLALRDNPNPVGNTDYFQVAENIQDTSNKIAAPSPTSLDLLKYPDKEIIIIGHPPLEQWQEMAKTLNKYVIIHKLGLDPGMPILVYAGTYGDNYENCFQFFLRIIHDDCILKNAQILIAPHPRYKGIVEKRLCSHLAIPLHIIGSEGKNISTVEALTIADVVATADATSTIVWQANALNKKVLHINPNADLVSQKLSDMGLFQKVSNSKELAHFIKTKKLTNEDVFQKFNIPKDGAKILWEEFITPHFPSLKN